jgi:tartrate/fumarate subfamily iron-sulfur-dependent hydro-lyase beta chain
MSEKIRQIQLPLVEEEARSLKLGELVTLSGTIFTGRSLFHIRAIEDDVFPPINYEKINTFFHVGPVMRQEDGEWRIVSLEPTSSIRFERYGADVIRKFNLRTIIGKTTMGPRTVEALKDVGSVYLSKIGLCGNQLSAQVKEVKEVYFLDELGKTEATWVLEVENIGPFFVAIDAHGNSYFDELNKSVCWHIDTALKECGVPEDYAYTNVDASE